MGRNKINAQPDFDQQVAATCGETPPSSWSAQQRAALVMYMRNLTDALHKHQLTGRRTSRRHATVSAATGR